ncbi:O-antigen ligase family protein [Sphingomonas sp. PB4P5]|uniref:O-antigen ligase family protein n=1 Tax=Parasphingomonas puruogangriensis TaxID=3096155 RepID=UPI002FC7EC27
MTRTALRHAIVPVYLLACLLLGGASAAGFIANLSLQLAALPLIAWSLWQLINTGFAPQVRSALILLALLVAIALLQLVPLPPAIWTHLPGRTPVIEGYRLLGTPLPWLPLTLAPEATLASLLWLLPAIATFLGIVALGAFRPRSIAGVIVAVTLISVLIGTIQVIGGADSAYFYEITNYGSAVGFFANSNHSATLLLVCIPFLAALQSAVLRRRGSPRTASAVRLLVGAIYAVIVVGLLMNGSQAGLGLLLPVALGTWLTFGRPRRALRRALAIFTVAATAAVILLVVIGPFGNNLFGEQTDHVEISRQTSFALTFRAARDYLPIGSGLGSFQPVYHTQEPLASVTSTYMNHAHNDWLELLLETGVPGIALAALVLFWGARRARTIWRAEDRDQFAQAAVIAATAILLHSLVDYPLRTAALSAVFAACIALIAGARPHVRQRDKPSSAKHLNL